MRSARHVAATILVVSALIGKAELARAADHSTDIVIADAGPQAAAVRSALLTAVALLPTTPNRIAVVDVTRNRPEVRGYLLTLDAFTVPGDGVI